MANEAIAQAAGLSCFNNPEDIQVLGGGMTNVNLRVRDGGREYVVRFGADIPEHGVMRWNELALSRAAEVAGLSPAVVYDEPGVMVLEYIQAQTLHETDVCKPDNLPRIVDLVGRVHTELAQHLLVPVLAFWPFQVIRTYITRLQAAGSAHSAALPGLAAEAERLEAVIGAVNLVIGHNDLLAANFLDDGQRLWLIDWEYGGFNTPLFDLAGLASNNGLTEVQERQMLEQYFDTDADLHWRPYRAMKCISLLRETLWSMVSEISSDLEFDYAAYTAENSDRLTAALADFRNL